MIASHSYLTYPIIGLPLPDHRANGPDGFHPNCSISPTIGLVRPFSQTPLARWSGTFLDLPGGVWGISTLLKGFQTRLGQIGKRGSR